MKQKNTNKILWNIIACYVIKEKTNLNYLEYHTRFFFQYSKYYWQKIALKVRRRLYYIIENLELKKFKLTELKISIFKLMYFKIIK